MYEAHVGASQCIPETVRIGKNRGIDVEERHFRPVAESRSDDRANKVVPQEKDSQASVDRNL